MPLVEVDEGELAIARASQRLIEVMHAKPETRERLFRLVKEVNPKAQIPELDVADPIRRQVEAQNVKIAKLEEDAVAREASRGIETRIESERARLRNAGWDDEAIGKIETLMASEGIPSYAAAEALYEKQTRRPTTVPTASPAYKSGWNLGDAGDDSLFADALKPGNQSGLMAWQDREINKALADERSGTRR